MLVNFYLDGKFSILTACYYSAAFTSPPPENLIHVKRNIDVHFIFDRYLWRSPIGSYEDGREKYE
jgi:hypothetical protein